MGETYEHFACLEAEETLDGLYRALWDRRWVSPPHHLRAVNHKIFQLRFAHQLGLATALTLITHNPDQALAFFQAYGDRMIDKPMRQIAIAYADGEAHGLYTTRITAERLEQYLDSIQYIPCLFQQLVSKDHELRINIIGERVWTIAIYSQEQEETHLGFRPFTEKCRHEPTLLPPALEQLCLELTHRLGLHMSNIDRIVTPAGEHIFLEINPNGQWAWIENMVGYPLCAALVDELPGVDTLTYHPYIQERPPFLTSNTATKNLGKAT